MHRECAEVKSEIKHEGLNAVYSEYSKGEFYRILLASVKRNIFSAFVLE